MSPYPIVNPTLSGENLEDDNSLQWKPIRIWSMIVPMAGTRIARDCSKLVRTRTRIGIACYGWGALS
jgi:hypothetical protein